MARCSPSFACKVREEEGCGGRGRLPIGDEHHRHGRHPLAKRRQREKARICTAPRCGADVGAMPAFFFSFFLSKLTFGPAPPHMPEQRKRTVTFSHSRACRWSVGRTCSAADRRARCGCRPAADRTCFPPGSFVLSFA